MSGSGTDVLELAFQYDELGRLEQLTDTTDLLAAGDPDASAVYSYDPRGRLSSASLAGATRWFRYDALGNLVGKDLASSGSAPNQGYAHPTKRHAVTDVAGVGTLAYDADGNVTRRFGHYQAFDSASRLVCVGTSPGGCDVLSVLHDADGRRIRETTSGSTLLFAGELFQYDFATGEAQASIFAFGERIAFKGIEAAVLRSAGGWTLELPFPGGSQGLLALAGLLGLGALGLLGARAGVFSALRARPLEASLSLGLSVLMGAPSPAWAGGPQPAAPEYRRWVFEDAQGSGLLVTDSLGNRVARRVFAPFGGVLDEVSTEATEETYATHRRETASGLYYMQARWYDPETGRFQSVDPVLRSLAEPQSHNAYSYVENDPINSLDPTGRADVNIQIDIHVGGGGFGIGGFGIGGFGGFKLCFVQGPECQLGGFGNLGSIFSQGGILSGPSVGGLGQPPLVTRFLSDARSQPGKEGADEESAAAKQARANIWVALRIFRRLYEEGLIDAPWIEEYEGGLDSEAFRFKYGDEVRPDKVADMDIEPPYTGATVCKGGASTLEGALFTVGHEIRHLERGNKEYWRAGGEKEKIAQDEADRFGRRVLRAWKKARLKK